MKVQGGGPVLQVFAGDFNIIVHTGDISGSKKSFLNLVFIDGLVTNRSYQLILLGIHRWALVSMKF
jgi:hypothetical protein